MNGVSTRTSRQQSIGTGVPLWAEPLDCDKASRVIADQEPGMCAAWIVAVSRRPAALAQIYQSQQPFSRVVRAKAVLSRGLYSVARPGIWQTVLRTVPGERIARAPELF